VISWVGDDLIAHWALEDDNDTTPPYTAGPDSAFLTWNLVSKNSTFTINESPEHGKHLWIRFSLDTNGDFADLDKVQVEEGSVPTPFEHRPYGVELALCQRYFQALGGSGTNYVLASGFTSSNTFYGQGKLSKTMRSSPSFSVSGTNSHFNYTHVAVAANANATPTVEANPESFYISVTSSTSTTSNAGSYFRIVNPATKAFFDAEL